MGELAASSQDIERSARSTSSANRATSEDNPSETALADVLVYAERGISQLDIWAPYLESFNIPLGRPMDKIVAEASLLLLIAERRHGASPALRGSMDQLARTLAPAARCERSRVMLMRFPGYVTALGLAHAVLMRVGLADSSFDHLVLQALATGEVDATERLPFRVMDSRWASALIRDEPAPQFNDVLPLSILRHLPHPIFMDRTDGYAITHAVMYATDFGEGVASSFIDVQAVTRAIDDGLLWTALEGDDDLLAELLLARLLVDPCAWSTPADLARRRLLGKWLGRSLRGPNYNLQQASDLSGAEAAAYEFQQTYHTLFVLGMLAAVGGLDDRDSSVTWPQTTGPQLDARDERAAIGRIVRDLREARAGLKAADWAEWVADQEGSGQAYGAVLDGLMIDACRRYDLSLVAALLSEAMRERVTPSRTLERTAQFLGSQRIASGGIGAYLVNVENAASPAARAVTDEANRVLREVAVYLEAGTPD